VTSIKKIGRQIIKIHIGDHNPPHVHVIGGSVSLMVVLSDLKVVGIGADEAKEALKWIKANRDELLAQWEKINE
jgi:hypothetical protein